MKWIFFDNPTGFLKGFSDNWLQIIRDPRRIFCCWNNWIFSHDINFDSYDELETATKMSSPNYYIYYYYWITILRDFPVLRSSLSNFRSVMASKSLGYGLVTSALGARNCYNSSNFFKFWDKGRKGSYVSRVIEESSWTLSAHIQSIKKRKLINQLD